MARCRSRKPCFVVDLRWLLRRVHTAGVTEVSTAPRWGLRLLLTAVALLPLVLLGGLVVSAELRARRLAETLVTEAVAQAAFSRERTPARGAEPGSLTDCLALALDAAPDVSRDAPWLSPQVLAVRAGQAPLESLPASALEALTKHDPWLRATLACTHLTTMAPVAGLGPLAEPLHARRQALPKLQEATAALAPLRVRLLVEHGQFREALEVCSDGLALVGDLLWLEGPEASLGGLGQSTGLVQPCADAVWKTADEALVKTFVTSLEQVGRNAPPYARVVQLERVAQEVRMFGAFFTADQVARLPVGARSMVSSYAPSRLERVGLANWWSSCDRAFLGVIAAADLPEPARTRAILTAQRDFESRWLSLVRVPPLDVRYQMYAESHEALPMSLEVLLVTAGLRTTSTTPPARFIDVKTTGTGGFELSPRTAEWRPLAVSLPAR